MVPPLCRLPSLYAMQYMLTNIGKESSSDEEEDDNERKQLEREREELEREREEFQREREHEAYSDRGRGVSATGRLVILHCLLHMIL